MPNLLLPDPQELPQHLSATMPARNRWLAAGAGVCVLLVLLSYYQLRFGLNVPPSGAGDEPAYDSLGWELGQGRGFQVNLSASVFRTPYDVYWNSSPENALPPDMQGMTANRPPLFSLMLAGLNRLFGRQFWSARVLNSACLAAVCSLLVTFLIRERGRKTACLGVFLFLVADSWTRLYGRTLMTEPLAAILTTLLILTLARLRSFRPGRTALAGGLFGLMVLTRSQFILWSPFLILFVVWLTQLPQSVSAGSWRTGFLHGIAFVVPLLFVLSPWMIRNCVVTGEFMPMGTQGATQLPAGFSDQAWELRGYWKNLAPSGFYDPALRPGMSLLEEEIAMAKYGKTQAWHWIRQHPVKALALAPLKVGHELLVQSPIQLALLLLAGIGAWRNWSIPEIRVGCGLFAINCLAVGMTWSVDDARFFVPLIFLKDALAALGLMAIAQTGKPGIA